MQCALEYARTLALSGRFKSSPHLTCLWSYRLSWCHIHAALPCCAIPSRRGPIQGASTLLQYCQILQTLVPIVHTQAVPPRRAIPGGRGPRAHAPRRLLQAPIAPQCTERAPHNGGRLHTRGWVGEMVEMSACGGSVRGGPSGGLWCAGVNVFRAGYCTRTASAPNRLPIHSTYLCPTLTQARGGCPAPTST